MTTEIPTLGVVLAGGQARRMGGGDKGLLSIGGETILERTLARFAPQCVEVVLNLNGDPKRLAALGLPVVADSVSGFAGPLAGVLAGMDWAHETQPDIEWIASVPGDCPFLPRDLLTRLHDARMTANKPIACAQSGDWRHPVAAIWPVGLREDLRQALVDEGLHKIEVWTERYGVALARWNDQPLDPFFNVNRPEDLTEAAKLAALFPDA